MSASSKKQLRKEQNAAKLTEKQLAEQKEAKKLKGYTIAFTAAVCLILVLAIGIMAVTAFKNSGIRERNTDALTVGQHTLSNAELNYYYIDAVNNFYSSYYNQFGENTDTYLTFMGLDTSKPLNEQADPSSEDGATYADTFKATAITNAANTYAIYDLADAAGHTVSDEVKATMDSTMTNLKAYATMYGYSDVDQYLKAMYGDGASEKTFQEYLRVQAIAESYQGEYYDKLTYTDSDISGYNKEHFDEFSSFSYAQYLLDVDDFIDCTDPDNKDHKHTDEEIQAAEAAAKAAAEQLIQAAPADADALNKAINLLDAFAEAETEETSTEYEKTLFPNITNEDISAWLAGADRKEGDITVIPYNTTSGEGDSQTTTLNGYYVVLFLGREDNEFPLVNVRHILSQFEGGTTDSATGMTTYSDAEKQKAKDALTAVQDKWKADGGTEEAFTALVKENTDDGGSADNGGLYEKVYPGQMVTAFNDWCFAEGRKTGDSDIVETEYGYHLMYFVGDSDVTFRNYMIENTLRNTDYEEWFTETTEAAQVKELDTQYLMLDLIFKKG